MRRARSLALPIATLATTHTPLIALTLVSAWAAAAAAAPATRCRRSRWLEPVFHFAIPNPLVWALSANNEQTVTHRSVLIQPRLGVEVGFEPECQHAPWDSKNDTGHFCANAFTTRGKNGAEDAFERMDPSTLEPACACGGREIEIGQQLIMWVVI